MWINPPGFVKTLLITLIIGTIVGILFFFINLATNNLQAKQGAEGIYELMPFQTVTISSCSLMDINLHKGEEEIDLNDTSEETVTFWSPKTDVSD